MFWLLAVLGVAHAEVSKKIDKKAYGENVDRGCKGDVSKSHAKINISGTENITRAQALLRPGRFPEGAGLYWKHPKSGRYTKVPNKFMPGSCRQDCSYGKRMWDGIKRTFTHIDKEGMIKRMIGEPCVWKKTGTSCEGVPCAVYWYVAKNQYVEIAEAEERKWAERIEEFKKSALGKFLAVVPVVGSELDILFKDVKGERPNAGDWTAFGVDIAFAMIPGGAGAVQGFKMAQSVVKGIAKAGFKEAVKAGSKTLVKTAAKKMVRDIYTNPTVRKFWIQSALTTMEKTAIKRLGRALSRQEKREILQFTQHMMDGRNEKMMEQLINEAEKIPDKYYLAIKDKSGMGKFESESRKAAEEAIKAGKKPKDIENAFVHFGYRRSMNDETYRMKKSDYDPRWGALPSQGKDGWMPWGVDIHAVNPHRTKKTSNWTIIAQKVDELTNKHFLGEKGAKAFAEFQKKRKSGKLLEDPKVKARITALRDAQKRQDEEFRRMKRENTLRTKLTPPKTTVKDKVKKGAKEVGKIIGKGAKEATKSTLKEIGKEAGKEIIKTIIKP